MICGARRGRPGRLRPGRRLGWLWVALSIGATLNGIRLRQRLAALPRLDPDGSQDATNAVANGETFVLVCAPGVQVDDRARSAAAHYASGHDLEVVDLVPPDLALDAAVDLAGAVDPATYRTNPLAPGRGSLHAMLVHREVARRLRIAAAPMSVLDRVSLSVSWPATSFRRPASMAST